MTGGSDERLLHELKSRGAQTAAALGARLGMTAPGARQHLLRLEAEGLIASEDRPAPRGRPKKFWRLTEKGHGRFPDRHSDLTLALIESTRAVFGAKGLDRLIAHREAATLALYRARLDDIDGLEAKVATLAGIRSEEGYMATCEQADDGALLLVEDHCPICAAAALCQGFCRAELAIFRAALPEASVERVEHLFGGARRCVYRITPESTKREAC